MFILYDNIVYINYFNIYNIFQETKVIINAFIFCKLYFKTNLFMSIMITFNQEIKVSRDFKNKKNILNKNVIYLYSILNLYM